MRDVTDNKTGELEVGEVKRGRGRPRKADAMTNAERQAAYRARHRAPNTVTVGGVTRKPGMKVSEVLAAAGEDWEAQAYLLRRERDEARLERKRAVAALEEARRQVRLAEEERSKAHEANAVLQAELAELKQQFVEVVAERNAAQAATKVVAHNGNPFPFDVMVDLIDRVRKARGAAERNDIMMWEPVRRIVVGELDDCQFGRLWSVVAPAKDVTRKAVTKKGAKA